MIDKNKSPNQRDDLFIAPKKCKKCNKDIKKENLLRNSGYCGYQKICRICKNKDSYTAKYLKTMLSDKFKKIA